MQKSVWERIVVKKSVSVVRYRVPPYALRDYFLFPPDNISRIRQDEYLRHNDIYIYIYIYIYIIVGKE